MSSDEEDISFRPEHTIEREDNTLNYPFNRFKEEGLSSDEEDISFRPEHTIEREDYEDLDKYLGNSILLF